MQLCRTNIVIDFSVLRWFVPNVGQGRRNVCLGRKDDIYEYEHVIICGSKRSAYMHTFVDPALKISRQPGQSRSSRNQIGPSQVTRILHTEFIRQLSHATPDSHNTKIPRRGHTSAYDILRSVQHEASNAKVNTVVENAIYAR
jgi:hypothetical protein